MGNIYMIFQVTDHVFKSEEHQYFIKISEHLQKMVHNGSK